MRSSGICITLDKTHVRLDNVLAVTYISGGTDWSTGMIGLLKYLCLQTIKTEWLGTDGAVCYGIPVSSLDIGLSRVAQGAVAK